MSNKTELKKVVSSPTGVKKNDKIINENPALIRRVHRKEKKRLQKSSVAQIEAAEGSAVGAVEANSSRTVRGSSSIANTGTIISYD